MILPAAAPGILAGLRAGIGQGWMAVIAAELFGIAGIGQRMMEATGLQLAAAIGRVRSDLAEQMQEGVGI